MIYNKDEMQAIPQIYFTSELNVQSIKITGKLVYGTTNSVKDKIKQSLDNNALSYLFDLSEIEYIDSTGFGVLINFAKTIAGMERKMAIVVTDSFIFDLFKISKLHLVFPVVKTKEEAYKLLNEGFDPKLPLEKY